MVKNEIVCRIEVEGISRFRGLCGEQGSLRAVQPWHSSLSRTARLSCGDDLTKRRRTRAPIRHRAFPEPRTWHLELGCGEACHPSKQSPVQGRSPDQTISADLFARQEARIFSWSCYNDYENVWQLLFLAAIHGTPLSTRNALSPLNALTMTDSPAIHVPLDPKEQPILDGLLSIRDELSLLKSDRSTYIRSEDVLPHYDAVIKQVHKLNDVRKESGNVREQNRVDRVLEDCFQLISLFFMTIGRTREAPVAYAFTSTMKRLLDHLKEAGFYAHKDIEGLDTVIDTLRESVLRGKEQYSEHLLSLLEVRLDACQVMLDELKAHVAKLSPQLSPTYEKLVSILRSMSAANTRKNVYWLLFKAWSALTSKQFPESEVRSFQDQCKEIEASMVDGKFVMSDGSVPEGQDVVIDLLNRCLVWSDLVIERYATRIYCGSGAKKDQGKARSIQDSQSHSRDYERFAIS